MAVEKNIEMFSEIQASQKIGLKLCFLITVWLHFYENEM